MVFNNNLLLGASGAGGYTIDQSIRFNDNDSAYLYRTPSAGNRKTWTWSAWVKRGNFTGATQRLWGSTPSSGSNNFNYGGIFFSSTDTLNYGLYDTSFRVSSAKFRDPSAWYHIVVALDTTQATASNRLHMYVNGVELTSFSTSNDPALNTDYSINQNAIHTLGSAENFSALYKLDGYLAEIHFIDGQQLDPSSFGEVNSDTGQWIAKEYSGSSGTNGFYITGEDSADLGADYSGNGNDFTSSGLTSADQMSDSPTNNWCVLNSVSLASTATLSDGNLTLSNTSTGATTCTLATPSSGKWYFEVKFDSESAATTSQAVGVVKAEEAYITGTSGGGIYFFTDGTRRIEGSDTGGWGNSWGVGDTIGVAIDLDDDKIWFAINNTWQASGDPSAGTNPAASGFSSEPYVALIRNGNSSRTTGWTANFGQNAFAYTPPTDFLALNSANLPDPTIVDPSAYFQTTLYEGDGSTQSIDQDGNSTFSPNFVWIKNRDATDAHALFDTVRGATEVLSSNSNAAEATNADTLTAFESDGFALGDDVIVNTNAESYVAWQWDAPTTSTNTDGSVDSTLSVSQTSGFSIGTFVGTGSTLTVGHGLGVAPDFIIAKIVESAAGSSLNWNVYHGSMGNTKALRLNLDGAVQTHEAYWGNTSPTSTVTTFGFTASINVNTKTTLAYSFAAVDGFSKFGSYEGTGSATAGPMVNLGFRPALIILKSMDSTSDWFMFDDKREGYNVDNDSLLANTTGAETTTDMVDLLSNGFKLRIATDPNVAETYVYAAFAENPFKTANAR
jgi:hypothetical protein